MDTWLVIRCNEQGSEVIGSYFDEEQAAAAASSHPQHPREVIFAAPARRVASRILDTEGE
jgi:hypothetical protein